MYTMLLFICIVFSYINLIYCATYQCDPSISCGCSVSTTNVTSRIVGGETAPDYAWSWIVSLQSSGKHICGVSLLTSEYAVTAAHCVEDSMNEISKLSILAGTNYLYDNSISTIQRKSITYAIMHPNYNRVTVENDIAILKFSPLTISSDSKITFICLPKEYEDPFQTNNNLVAIGWGYLWEDVHYLSRTLQQVTIQAVSSTLYGCQKSGMVNPSVQFCAGTMTGDKDTCQGDSGGPLMAFVNNRWVLAGITSLGRGCAHLGYPGVYTRVSTFISFINSNVNFPLTTTVSLTTSANQRNNNQSSTEGNNGNMITKSIAVVIVWFSLLV
ncbi:unnamed protein product [Rotaria sp. Silwood2]|nr:unnamed protein product [Rotaria sp. Silwood2]CAF3291509.1 unnamed protein product [Rotaria sp. Silwood2]